MKRVIELRSIDRVILVVMAILMVLGGLYLAGPLYLDRELTGGAPSPIYATLNSITATRIFGVGYLISGVTLMVLAIRKGITNASHLAWALMAAFSFRTFALIGTIIALPGWLPPSYLPSFAVIGILGAYWVWVKRYERTTH